jgi:hypothetical protein
MATVTRRILLSANLLVASLVALSAGPAQAGIRLWESWKVDRPQGPGITFFIEMETLRYPGLRQNLYFVPAPGSASTTAPLPSDVDITVHLIADGHSGKFAKYQDRKELAIRFFGPDHRSWETLARQTREEQERLPTDKRWSGVLRARMSAEKLPFGLLIFKADMPYNASPPTIFLSRADQTLREMIDEAADVQSAPGEDPPPFSNGQRGVDQTLRPGAPALDQAPGAQLVSAPTGPGATASNKASEQLEPVSYETSSTAGSRAGFDPEKYAGEEEQKPAPPGNAAARPAIPSQKPEAYGTPTRVRYLAPAQKTDYTQVIVVTASLADRRKSKLRLRWKVNGSETDDILISPGLSSVTGRFRKEDKVEVVIHPEDAPFWMVDVRPTWRGKQYTFTLTKSH